MLRTYFVRRLLRAQGSGDRASQAAHVPSEVLEDIDSWTPWISGFLAGGRSDG